MMMRAPPAKLNNSYFWVYEETDGEVHRAYAMEGAEAPPEIRFQ